MIDYLNKPGKELLLDLVNDDNKSTFTFDQISFGPPVVISMNQDERNTSCVVTAEPTSPWYGSTPVTFERLFFERMFVDQEVEASTDEIQNDQQLLDALNAEYGLELQPTDVEIIGSYPTPGNYGSLTVKAKPGSYVYLGEFVVAMVGSKIQLIDYITHKVLDGLSYPTGNVSKLTKPRNILAIQAPANATDSNGGLRVLPLETLGTWYQEATNTELVVDLGVDVPGRVEQDVDGGYKLYETDATNMVFSFALQDVEFAEGDITNLYDLRILIRSTAFPEGAEYKMVKTGTDYAFVTEAGAAVTTFSAVVFEANSVLQTAIPVSVLKAGGAALVAAVAIRKGSMAPRLLSTYKIAPAV